MSELCARYEISRKTGYKWLKRYDEGGFEALADWSRAPLRHPNAVALELEQAVVAHRQQFEHWGPKKIKKRLKEAHPDTRWPALSTIGAILKRHGLVKARLKRRRVPVFPGPLQESVEPNEVWATDFKGWFCTQDGTRIHPLTVSDHATRYFLLCHALPNVAGALVKEQFEKLFHTYGLPRRIRSDNGAPFAAPGLTGLSALSVWWIRLGIIPERGRPGHPQDNGRHERIHRNVEQETASPPEQTVYDQQQAFDHHLRLYNEERPHESLGMKRPSQCYRPSARMMPSRLPEPEYPMLWQTRRVRQNGTFKWRGQLLFLGETLSGQTIALHQREELWHDIYFGPVLIARLHNGTNTVSAFGKH